MHTATTHWFVVDGFNYVPGANVRDQIDPFSDTQIAVPDELALRLKADVSLMRNVECAISLQVVVIQTSKTIAAPSAVVAIDCLRSIVSGMHSARPLRTVMTTGSDLKDVERMSELHVECLDSGRVLRLTQ